MFCVCGASRAADGRNGRCIKALRPVWSVRHLCGTCGTSRSRASVRRAARVRAVDLFIHNFKGHARQPCETGIYIDTHYVPLMGTCQQMATGIRVQPVVVGGFRFEVHQSSTGSLRLPKWREIPQPAPVNLDAGGRVRRPDKRKMGLEIEEIVFS